MTAGKAAMWVAIGVASAVIAQLILDRLRAAHG